MGALLATAATAVPASAAKPAPKPLCRLVTDDVGDGYLRYSRLTKNRAFSEDSLDVVSADVATSARTVSAIVRLVAIRPDDAAVRSGGAVWTVSFDAGGSRFNFGLMHNPNIQSRGLVDTPYLKINDQDGPTPEFRVGPSSITWTIARSKLRAFAKKRVLLNRLRAQTWLYSGNADDAPSAREYPDKARSCLAVR